MGKHIKTFESFSEITKPKTYGNSWETMLVNLKSGSFLTQEDLDRNLEKIESLYNHTESGLDDLKDICYYNKRVDDNGGIIWRIYYLSDTEELDLNNLGIHWSPEIEYLKDNMNRFSSTMRSIINKREPYILKAWTPPHNNSLPDDIYANLEEIEVLILDPSKVKPLEIFNQNMKSIKKFE